MPNGADKNLQRLLAACAVHRQKHGEWPSQARLEPSLLQNLAHVLDGENFARLAAHLELRTRDRPGLSVGGRGAVEYGDIDHGRVDADVLALAERWLGVEPRRELEH
jgi:hypothetical protein